MEAPPPTSTSAAEAATSAAAATAAAPAACPPRPVGSSHWRLTGSSPIGRGSFADVWAGTDGEGIRRVAIKSIPTARLSPKLRAGLASEVAILRASRHAHVVELLDVVETGDTLFLIMEFCAGGDVAGLLRASPGGRLAEPDAKRLGGHLAAGLRCLWAAGCVHRDLKPHNLLLCVEEGAAPSTPPPVSSLTLRIADFGFARSLGPAALADTLCGSPLYMAPEVLRHGR